MMKVWSHVLGAVSMAMILGTTGCQGTGTQETGTSALRETEDTRHRTPEQDTGLPEEDPTQYPPGEGEPWPQEPGDRCEELFEEIAICHEIHLTICEDVHNDLMRCHETQFATCEALLEAVFTCEATGADCEPLRLQADECFATSQELCEGIAVAVDTCFEPCFALEHQVEIECWGGNECDEPREQDACSLLHEALGACHFDRPPELCITIEAALLTVCADGPHGPGGPYGPEGPPDEHGPGEPEHPEDPGEPEYPEERPPGS